MKKNFLFVKYYKTPQQKKCPLDVSTLLRVQFSINKLSLCYWIATKFRYLKDTPYLWIQIVVIWPRFLCDQCIVSECTCGRAQFIKFKDLHNYEICICAIIIFIWLLWPLFFLYLWFLSTQQTGNSCCRSLVSEPRALPTMLWRYVRIPHYKMFP